MFFRGNRFLDVARAAVEASERMNACHLGTGSMLGHTDALHQMLSAA